MAASHMKMAWTTRVLSLCMTSIMCVSTMAAASGKYYCLSTAAGSAMDASQFTVREDACDAAAVIDAVEAFYDPTFNETGWDYLKISTLKYAEAAASFTSTGFDLLARPSALFAAGYLEGYLTFDRIWAMYLNTIPPLNVTFAVSRWIDDQMAYINGTSAEALAAWRRVASANSSTVPSNETVFWLSVHSMLRQIEGMQAGYTAALSQPDTPWAPASMIALTAQPLNATQFFWLSFQLEFDDVNAAMSMTQQGQPNVPPPTTMSSSSRTRPRGHCSGLIRSTQEDLLVSHVTWFSYQYMLRQYKVYQFGTTRIGLSGYAGVVHSSDDWYTSSQSLAIQETTNLLYNQSLYVYLTPRTVPEFIRIMTANYFATTAPEWVYFASYNNSGTYNNQWMVVDMKQFTPATPGGLAASVIGPDTLWIFEQLPGPYLRYGDVTDVLRRQGYWASYNLPYFPDVYIASGNQQMYETYGSFFSYHEYARPLMFARMAPNVTNLTDMETVMRYNDYRHDPLSRIPNCTGEPNEVCQPPFSATLAIASRGDLDPFNSTGMGPLGNVEKSSVMQFGMQNLGAIDAKITSYSLLHVAEKAAFSSLALTEKIATSENGVLVNYMAATQEDGRVICGPPVGGASDLAPFNFSGPIFFGMSRYLLAQQYDFPWVTYSTIAVPAQPSQPCARSPALAILFGVGGGLAAIAALIYLINMVMRRRSKGDEAAPLNA